MPSPSPPHETFRDVNFVNEPLDVNRAIIPSTILDDETTDERIIAAIQFLPVDEFIKAPEFKSFWLQAKLKDLSEDEMAYFDKDNIDISLDESIKMIKESGMLLV